MEEFKKLGVSYEVLEAIKELGFKEPTDIQKKAIPLVMQGKDIIAGAATGSGKTLVFGSAIIKNCEKKDSIQALILAPTRELAEQIAQNLKMFSKYKPMIITEVYGGVSINPQITSLKRTDVVVGTPGRILDHINRNTINLRNVKMLVLDEVDRMFDMGFIDDVKKIIREVPKKRQSLFFAATISQEVSRISEDYSNKPIEVSCVSEVDPSKLVQFYYDVPDNLKFSLLVHLLKNEESNLVMVFCNTQRATDFVADNLKKVGINAIAIHGGHSQDKREKTMADFHSKDFEVLVCTDVAARGLDIKDVSHVYNYDIPKEATQYIHRIGRTARAGKEGKAVNILASRDYENFRHIKNKSNAEIEKLELPEFEKVYVNFQENNFRQRSRRPCSFRREGRRYGGGGGYRGGRNEGGYRREGRRDERRERGNRRFGRNRERNSFRRWN